CIVRPAKGEAVIDPAPPDLKRAAMLSRRSIAKLQQAAPRPAASRPTTHPPFSLSGKGLAADSLPTKRNEPVYSGLYAQKNGETGKKFGEAAATPSSLGVYLGAAGLWSHRQRLPLMRAALAAARCAVRPSMGRCTFL